eukprot:7256508-Prymnesium_polylepis.1
MRVGSRGGAGGGTGGTCMTFAELAPSASLSCSCTLLLEFRSILIERAGAAALLPRLSWAEASAAAAFLPSAPPIIWSARWRSILFISLYEIAPLPSRSKRSKIMSMSCRSASTPKPSACPRVAGVSRGKPRGDSRSVEAATQLTRSAPASSLCVARPCRRAGGGQRRKRRTQPSAPGPVKGRAPGWQGGTPSCRSHPTCPRPIRATSPSRVSAPSPARRAARSG